MFEFITISNGLVVVQHWPSGCVYRFRPMHPGLWDRLALAKVEAGADGHVPDREEAARDFAQQVATAVCGFEAPMPEPQLANARGHFLPSRLRPAALN